MTAIAAISTAAAALFAYWATRATRRSSNAQVFLSVERMLQDDEMRKSRGALYHAPPYASWLTLPESASAAYMHHCEVVSQAFNTAGYLIEKGLLDQNLVIDLWGQGIVDMWAVCSPEIQTRRTEEGFARLWVYFENLARAAARKGYRPQARLVAST